MEYAGVRNLYDECKDRVKEVYGSFDIHNKQHYSLYDYYLKIGYTSWAIQNNLKEELLEQGWETFLND